MSVVDIILKENVIHDAFSNRNASSKFRLLTFYQTWPVVGGSNIYLFTVYLFNTPILKHQISDTDTNIEKLK